LPGPKNKTPIDGQYTFDYSLGQAKETDAIFLVFLHHGELWVIILASSDIKKAMPLAQITRIVTYVHFPKIVSFRLVRERFVRSQTWTPGSIHGNECSFLVCCLASNKISIQPAWQTSRVVRIIYDPILDCTD
jgi:hypothetical protein